MVQKKKNKKSTKTNTIEIKKNNDRKEGEQQPLIGFHEGYRYIKLMLCPLWARKKHTEKQQKLLRTKRKWFPLPERVFFCLLLPATPELFVPLPQDSFPRLCPHPGMIFLLPACMYFAPHRQCIHNASHATDNNEQKQNCRKKPHIRYSLKTRFQYRYHAVFVTARQ
ncbi:hypothetical protein, partial [Escherichia coli]|uniref:hypothetical protein n=1 Tax=Escherichia coli TaxID=562 RepID=UPI001BC8A11B